jgi:hypothetical protein
MHETSWPQRYAGRCQILSSKCWQPGSEARHPPTHPPATQPPTCQHVLPKLLGKQRQQAALQAGQGRQGQQAAGAG